jgi:hypothetical protein
MTGLASRSLSKPKISCATGGQSVKLSLWKKAVRKFRSFAEADKADFEYYHSLTPEQRLDILGELIRRAHPDKTGQRIQKVCRIINTPRGLNFCSCKTNWPPAVRKIWWMWNGLAEKQRSATVPVAFNRRLAE